MSTAEQQQAPEVNVDLETAVLVLQAAGPAGMMDPTKIPEGEKEKIEAANHIVTLALQIKSVVEIVGRTKVPKWPDAENILRIAQMLEGQQPTPAPEQEAPVPAVPAPAVPSPVPAVPAVEPPVPAAAPPAPAPPAAPPAPAPPVEAPPAAPAPVAAPAADQPAAGPTMSREQAEAAADEAEKGMGPGETSWAGREAFIREMSGLDGARPVENEWWVNESGNRFKVIRYGGGPELEIVFAGTEQTTTVPSGYAKQLSARQDDDAPISPQPISAEHNPVPAELEAADQQAIDQSIAVAENLRLKEEARAAAAKAERERAKAAEEAAPPAAPLPPTPSPTPEPPTPAPAPPPEVDSPPEPAQAAHELPAAPAPPPAAPAPPAAPHVAYPQGVSPSDFVVTDPPAAPALSPPALNTPAQAAAAAQAPTPPLAPAMPALPAEEGPGAVTPGPILRSTYTKIDWPPVDSPTHELAHKWTMPDGREVMVCDEDGTYWVPTAFVQVDAGAAPAPFYDHSDYRSAGSAPAPQQGEEDQKAPYDPAAAYDDTEDVPNDDGDEVYKAVMADTFKVYSPNGMPIPLNLQNPPEAMPADLTEVSDIENRRYHSQFNAMAARAKFLHDVEAAIERKCQVLYDEAMKKAKRIERADKGDQSKITLEEIKEYAQDYDDCQLWIGRVRFHKGRADAWKTLFDIYSQNVKVLSRDWTMKDTEREG